MNTIKFKDVIEGDTFHHRNALHSRIFVVIVKKKFNKDMAWDSKTYLVVGCKELFITGSYYDSKEFKKLLYPTIETKINHQIRQWVKSNG